MKRSKAYRAAAEKIETAPWDEITEGGDPNAANLRSAVGQLMGAIAQSAHAGSSEQQQRILDIVIDVPAHKVSRGDELVSLTPLEFDLLVALARKPRQVFTREVLLEQVWGYRHAADTRLVNVHVQRLRAKVEKDPENPEVVLTVRGVGYKAGPP